MTPFDGVALLAMLRAFYPVPSSGALRIARQERPEYFAGGELFGTHGDKFRLPDGRVFDLIYDVEGVSGGPLWQVIEPGPGGDDDPFGYEPGPLVPIDAHAATLAPLDPVFEGLVSAHLAGVSGEEHVLEQRAGELVAAAAASDIDSDYDASAGAAARALEDHLRAFDDLSPAEGSSQADGLTGSTHDAQQDYPDPDKLAPPEITVDPSPGGTPASEGGAGPPWYVDQEAP